MPTEVECTVFFEKKKSFNNYARIKIQLNAIKLIL